MASKNIVAKGTTYNGVESVTFPVSGGGNATFYEISDTTASATDVLNSKYFYTASGVKTQGTGTAPSPTLITKSITVNGTYNASSDSADGYSSVTVNVSGGGGGLVYETGTWTPSEDVASYVISFANTHTEAPFFYAVWDATGTELSLYPTNLAVVYVDHYKLAQTGIPYNNTANGYSTIYFRTRYSSATGNNSAATIATFSSSDSGSSGTSYARYWATEAGIKAYCNDSNRLWRTGRTYKWIAVWTPTT